MRKILLALLFLVAVPLLAGDPLDSVLVVTAQPSAYGDAVVRWVDLSDYATGGTWFVEYHVQVSPCDDTNSWCTLAIIDGAKPFYYSHKNAWARGLSYRVVALPKLLMEADRGR